MRIISIDLNLKKNYNNNVRKNIIAINFNQNKKNFKIMIV